MITKDNGANALILLTSLNQFLKEMYGDQFGELVCGYWGLEGEALMSAWCTFSTITIHTFPKVVIRIYLTIEVLMISAFLYTQATIKKACVAG